MPGMPGGQSNFGWAWPKLLGGRLLEEEAQFGVIEETSPNHSMAEAKRAMKRSNPMRLVGAAQLLTHPLDRC